MPFTNTISERRMTGGLMYEIGTWALTGGATTGTITPATTGQGWSAGIREILDFSLASNDNSSAMVGNLVAMRKNLQITSAANDTGDYTIIGRPA